MSRIIVAGGGNGGLVAAIHLAKAGHTVTLFERNNRENIGMPQTDAFDYDTFDYAGIPVAPYFKRGKNVITFVPSDSNLDPLTLPQVSENSFLVDRKELASYLFTLAEEAGAEIIHGEAVSGPIILGNRVCGITTDKGEYYCDLVIDACGIYSPVRSNLPEHMGVNREIKKYDIIHSYRGYFNRVPDTPEPITDYNIYFKNDGNVGFSWLVTEFDRVDALICRFYKPSDSEILDILKTTHEENPHMGLDLIYGGEHRNIPVCQPLGVLVADGYAAVGDSAFMTIALKGSGITYSMKAGKMLADCVLSDENGCYDQESLWEYQRRFFKEIGFSACSFALFKNILPYLTAEEVNELFKSKIITTQELTLLWENKMEAVFNAKGIATLKDKIRLVRDNPKLKEVLGNLALWLGRFAVLQTSFPMKYNKKDISDWAQKYNNFFDSIRRKD